MRNQDSHAAILWRITTAILACLFTMTAVAEINIARSPLFIGSVTPPLTMLVMGRDHTLYYEAYNDASDLNGDGILDVGYKPGIDYFGYFNSYLCYTYGSGRFAPAAISTDKTCSGAGQWSGDFLNYVTTARIDALRKVLYGGRRIVDTATETVLERSYIPQDAHSWGKEYLSIAHDGYDIRDYTPLNLPASGTRHLFANTTLLTTGAKEPLMRVLTDSRFRIWEWVAVERPVAGDDCVQGATRQSCVTSATTQSATHPANAAAFAAMMANWATETQRCGSGTIASINTTGSNNNPYSGSNSCTQEYYLTRITGEIYIPAAGDYQFATNGDDAVELLINGSVVTGWYGGHGARTDANLETRANNTGSVVTVTLAAGWHPFEFRHEELTGSDSYQLLWRPLGLNWEIVPALNFRGLEGTAGSQPRIETFRLQRTIPASARTDYVVRVQVCAEQFPEAHCKTYPQGTLKPTGLLQEYGEADDMLFGLLSGSYGKNTAGGVLRKNIESFRDELDPDTGIFTDLLGIVRTIDRFRIVDFNMASNYQYRGGWLVTQSMANNPANFLDWGNPIGEMMYESLRYFSGKTSATSQFLPSLTGGQEVVTLMDYTGDETTMALPVATWQDPFTRTDQVSLVCSPAAQLVISDINPSYDTQFVPGTAFGSFAGDIAGFNAQTEANAIWDAEFGSGSRQHFIGQVGTDYDGAPSAKTVTGLGNIRGLAPAEPTKQGGYYSAAAAKYAFESDLRPDLRQDLEEKQKVYVHTFAVALASPLPRIEIPVGSQTVTVVPFGKTVVAGSMSNDKGSFQPTNTIVDFFVEQFANTGATPDASVNEGRPYIRFRVNFEDVEQGADHDMDAIIVYELRVTADNRLQVNLAREYEAAGYTMNYGYVISGTTADGIYLDVSSKTANPGYFLNTPPGQSPGSCDLSTIPETCANLPLVASREFNPGTGDTATLLEGPLWFAAKYGSKDREKLTSGQASPNYFLVTNASNLQEQLEKAFRSILDLTSAASAPATTSTRADTSTVVYQAQFFPKDWHGKIQAYAIKENYASLEPGESILQEPVDWARIPAPDDRLILTWNPALNDGSGGAVAFDADAFADEDGLSQRQRAALMGLPVATIEPLTLEQLEAMPEWGDALKRLGWLRGETQDDLRDRENSLLGDIVHSTPYLVGQDDYGFARLPVGSPERPVATGIHSYTEFLTSLNDPDAPRTPMLYVGANDGMLHAFNAKIGDTDYGKEVFAFIPEGVSTHLADLSNPDYAHRFFVDGSPRAVDAFIKVKGQATPAWRTILVGSTGAGGRSVFALDVTDPLNFTADSVLWEFQHEELGVAIGQPTIARIAADNRWVAIFGNGYNSQSATSGIFVVDLATGELLRYFDTEVGSGETPNGMATVTAVDVSFDRPYDRIADFAYAGDHLGHVWKLDLSPASLGAATLSRVYSAQDASGAPQPITAALAVAAHPFGGQMLLFGTGRYFAVDDNIVEEIAADEPVQTLYGIRDQSSSTAFSGRENLLKQEIIKEFFDPDFNLNLRVLSNHAITTQRGWYLDLTHASAEPGERVREQAVIRDDRAVFVTLIPDTDPCAFGGTGWLMEIDLLTGGRLNYSVFDLNTDNQFNADDFVTITIGEEEIRVPVTGRNFDAIPSKPVFVSIPDEEGNIVSDVKMITLSTGIVREVRNNPRLGVGPQSWQQLQ